MSDPKDFSVYVVTDGAGGFLTATLGRCGVSWWFVPSPDMARTFDGPEEAKREATAAKVRPEWLNVARWYPATRRVEMVR